MNTYKARLFYIDRQTHPFVGALLLGTMKRIDEENISNAQGEITFSALYPRNIDMLQGK